MSKFVPSPQEVALVNQIFTQTDSQKIGVVTGEAAVKIFGGSKLPPSVLAEIWNLSDEDNKGVLTRKDVAVAVRLLGHAQRGETISEALIHRPGAPPSIEGLNVPISGQGTGGRVAKSPPPGPGSALPPLTAQDKAKFAKLFHGYGPQNGLLPGDKARDVFVKSKLPVDKLSQIWALADSKSRGSLDVTDFTIAMYLIQGSMSGTLPTIPPFLPPYIYEQAKSGPDAVVSHGTGSSTSFSPSLTGGFPGRPVQPQYTGQGILQPQYTGQGILQPQSTGHRPTPPIPPRSTNVSNISNLSHSSPFSIPAQSTGQQWDVTPAEKASADSFFDTLDTQKRGYIEGDVAVPFMLQSKLSDDILAQIWDLSDMDNNGRLTRDGFAVAFHLIQSKLAGKDIPSTLPPSLVPPSKRGNLPAAAPPQPQVPEAIKDLLWDDTPPQSAVPQPSIPTLQPQRTGALSPQPTAQPTQPPQPTASAFGNTDPFAPTSSPFATTSSPFTTPAASSPFTVPTAAPPPPTAHKDLLGDDDEPVAASPPLQDKSAEIGNVQNQLSSTNRAVETAKQEREDLERRVAEQESQLSSLQTQLSSSKAAYESETHTLATLRERYSAQTAEIQKTRTELIHAESNLSAIREEKNEVSSNLLRDKDEVRELQRKMTEVGLEVESLKAEVEKAKKDAKQQKGLLAIAKKQLATREAERAKIAKELEEAQAEAAQATKEREEAEAELAKVPEVPAAVPAPERVASPAQSITAFAAAQPLPSSPEPTPSQIASPASTKSNNPFERLAFGGSPRPESPFLPFAGSVLPTPPTGGDAEQTPTIAAPAPAPATAAPTTEATQSADPFGFDDAFGGGESKSSEQEPQTATSIPEGSPFGVVAQDQDNEVQHIPGTPFDVMSPTDTEMFHTPPSTAVPILGGSPASSAAPAPESKEPQSFASAFPENEAPKDQGKEDEQTDLNTQLKELDVNESDSDTDSDDDEPLTNVKAKLTESHPENGEATAGTSAFDDAFSAPSPTAPAPAPAPVVAESSTPVQAPEPTATETTPKPPAAPFTAPEASKQNGSADSGAPAGVSDFDEALGLSGSGTNTSQFTHVSDFTFDSAFDDDFDFAAAKAATVDPAVNGTNASAPSPAAASTPTTGSYFPPPAISPPSTSQVSTTSPFPAAPTSTSAFPAAPSAATRPKSEAFDAIFLPQASQNKSAEGSSVPPSAGPSQTLSFDDTFGGDSSAPKAAPPVTQPTTSNGGHGISFDDAFGGNPTESLALDSSFSSSTQSQHYAPPSSPPPGLKGTTPFPSSTPASPTRDGQSSRRSLSPAPRTASPPPRPKSRPSTSQSEKDGKEKTTRHSKLSIRLPFGRKKAKHDPMPSQLSHSLLVEEPSNDATPAADDDIEAVKTLCGMGFSRTQAVTALEQYDYDVQRALNSLLGTR